MWKLGEGSFCHHDNVILHHNLKRRCVQFFHHNLTVNAKMNLTFMTECLTVITNPFFLDLSNFW